MTKHTENIKHFQDNKYCVVKKVISKETADIITQYALFDEMQNYNGEIESLDKQVPNAHSVYGDPAMEAILLHLLPIVEQHTGIELYPTYSYYRVYRDGDSLPIHKDRPACEISTTICFNYDFNNHKFQWPIYVGDTEIKQEPRDMTIYRGFDLEHYREKLELNDEEVWQVQGFFHYVDANGPFAEWKYDKRSSIGMNDTKFKKINKPYIEYTK